MFARRNPVGLSPSPRTRRRRHTPELRPAVLRLLDSMAGVSAFLRDHRFDIQAVNPLGRALYAPMFATHPDLPVNSMRFTCRHPDRPGQPSPYSFCIARHEL
ncbi:MAG TPA: hypothetical protein VN408_26855 [Actinoplanes sp.]|nr:hypothetical protein [Actinoplanes sp.]